MLIIAVEQIIEIIQGIDFEEILSLANADQNRRFLVFEVFLKKCKTLTILQKLPLLVNTSICMLFILNISFPKVLFWSRPGNAIDTCSSISVTTRYQPK